MLFGVFMTILLKTARFKASIYITFGLTFGLSASLLGQTNSVSPLSIIGFGETSFGVTPNYLAMGGTGIANVDRFSINMFNPAGYMNLDFVTLEMSGAHRSFRHRITDEDIDQVNFNTYFDFFGFGFKFNSYFAGSFAITPIDNHLSGCEAKPKLNLSYPPDPFERYSNKPKSSEVSATLML